MDIKSNYSSYLLQCIQTLCIYFSLELCVGKFPLEIWSSTKAHSSVSACLSQCFIGAPRPCQEKLELVHEPLQDPQPGPRTVTDYPVHGYPQFPQILQCMVLNPTALSKVPLSVDISQIFVLEMGYLKDNLCHHDADVICAFYLNYQIYWLKNIHNIIIILSS